MRSFEYYSPRALREALALLNTLKQETKILAGGTDLITQMKAGSIHPAAIIDIKNVPELNRLELKGDMSLHIGAAVPLNKIIAFPSLRNEFGILGQGCSLIGSLQIRNRATLGGNICNAAPSGDSLPALLCLGAKAVIKKTKGSRKVLLENFFTGPGQTVLTSDELLVEVEVPAPSANSFGCYLRHTPREEMDIGVVGVASFIVTDSKNACKKARIALASVAPTPLLARKAEAILMGKVLTDKIIAEAAEEAAKEASPISDVRGSAAFRSEIVKVLTVRTLGKIRDAMNNKA
jgi:aerobic carbon-monoxide dehydrogenase medium subunit